MVETYILNTDPLDDKELFNEKLKLVDDTRRKKVLRLSSESQKTSLGAGLLIKAFVGDITSYNEYGKPLSVETYFNVSHSGKYVVLTTANEPVGVDIQIMQRGRNKIASRFFSVDECIQIDQSHDPDKTFTQIWSLKEAFLKCIGTGIGQHFRDFSILLNGGNIKVEQDITDNIYYFKEYNITGYQLAVCCENNYFAENIKDVTQRILK